MSKTLSITEAVASLTGYEEQKIEDRFGANIATLLDTNGIKACRALLFVHTARTTTKDAEAYKQVMGMPISEVDAAFQTDDEDADDLTPNEPYSEQGKDDSPSA